MTADARSIRDAWQRIPSPGAAGTSLERFTGNRMERILGVVIALGSAVLGAQAFIAALSTMSRTDLRHIALLLLVFVPLALMLIGCVTDRFKRVGGASFAIAYVIALALWPAVANAKEEAASDQPWIFFLVNVCVIAAVLAFPLGLQFAWAAGLPFVYGWVRLEQGGFASDFWLNTGFDVSFTLILGMVLVSLAWMFRSVAAGVDEARERAITTYTAAASATAVEEERVALAALMHDSVLAALIAAARAASERERHLAVGMAREALTRLANTEASIAQEGTDDPVATTAVVAELRRALSERGADAAVEEQGEAMSVPGKVARAVVLAARQAIGNAIEHAGGRGLHVLVDTDQGLSLAVRVSDAGPGFVFSEIGEDRLGIRASIIARMAAVAGTAHIDSSDAGTAVTMGWVAE